MTYRTRHGLLVLLLVILAVIAFGVATMSSDDQPPPAVSGDPSRSTNGDPPAAVADDSNPRTAAEPTRRPLEVGALDPSVGDPIQATITIELEGRWEGPTPELRLLPVADVPPALLLEWARQPDARIDLPDDAIHVTAGTHRLPPDKYLLLARHDDLSGVEPGHSAWRGTVERLGNGIIRHGVSASPATICPVSAELDLEADASVVVRVLMAMRNDIYFRIDLTPSFESAEFVLDHSYTEAGMRVWRQVGRWTGTGEELPPDRTVVFADRVPGDYWLFGHLRRGSRLEVVHVLGTTGDRTFWQQSTSSGPHHIELVARDAFEGDRDIQWELAADKQRVTGPERRFRVFGRSSLPNRFQFAGLLVPYGTIQLDWKVDGEEQSTKIAFDATAQSIYEF